MTREEKLAGAGAYVLGLLEGAELSAFETALAGDGELKKMTASFADRMASLDDSALPADVSPGLWSRIEAELGPSATIVPIASATPKASLSETRQPYTSATPRWMAMAASALAALGVGYLVGNSSEDASGDPVAVAVLLLETDGSPGAVVEAYADDSVRLQPLQAFAVPQGRIMQVWTLPDKETGPVSLGTIPQPGAARLQGPHLPAPKDGQLYEITFEPQPGSPTGKPTGPILVKGFAKLQ